MENALHIVDYLIFSIVLLISFAIGFYHAFTGGKQSTPGEYLTGNRHMSLLPVTLSILVSFLSAITVLGTPAEMYTRGTQLFMRTIGYCLACLISSIFIVPLFYSLKVTSSFEYLEKRFKSRATKLIGTISMLIGSVFYMGLLLYTPASAISASTKLPIIPSILLVSIVTTAYTTLGGFRGVVWTDAFQALVMLVGIVVILVKGVMLVGGIEEVWRINEQEGRIKFFDFNPDPLQRLSFWSTVFGGTINTLTIFGVGQASVQRYCSLPTLKKAKLCIFLNIPFLFLMNVLSSFVGLVIFAFYASIQCDPIKNGDISSSNQLVPYFVVTQLNLPGLPGAFLAVLFSGSLSSMSSMLNSCAAVTWQDLLSDHVDKIAKKIKNIMLKKKRNKFLKSGDFPHESDYITDITGRGDLNDKNKTTIIKVLVILYGLAALGMAFLARLLGQHVLQASLSFSGATMGPTLGMFLLGAFFAFSNYKGAIVGCVVSSIITLWITIGAFIQRPYQQSLPTSVAACQHNSSTLFTLGTTLLSTSTRAPTPESGGIEAIYKLSFLWYSALGCVLTLIIGSIISLATRKKMEDEVDRKMLIRMETIFSCFCAESEALQPHQDGTTRL